MPKAPKLPKYYVMVPLNPWPHGGWKTSIETDTLPAAQLVRDNNIFAGNRSIIMKEVK